MNIPPPRTILAGAIVVTMLWTGRLDAQDATTQPVQRTSGAYLQEHRPGVWVQAGIEMHVKWQTKAFHGGEDVELIPELGQEGDDEINFLEEVLMSALQAALDRINFYITSGTLLNQLSAWALDQGLTNPEAPATTQPQP